MLHSLIGTGPRQPALHSGLAALLNRRAAEGDRTATRVYGDPARAAEWFQARLRDGDPECLRIWVRQLRIAVGPDPLAAGACDWPKEMAIAQPGEGSWQLDEGDAIHGWRWWTVTDAGQLVAPFMSVSRRLPRPEPRWGPGVNVRSDRCTALSGRRWDSLPDLHPSPACQCGFRAVRSLTVLNRLRGTPVGVDAPVQCVAEVALWGNVAGPDYADDWPHTIRSSHAKVVGPLHITTTAPADVVDRLAERFNTEVLTSSAVHHAVTQLRDRRQSAPRPRRP